MDDKWVAHAQAWYQRYSPLMIISHIWVYSATIAALGNVCVIFMQVPTCDFDYIWWVMLPAGWLAAIPCHSYAVTCPPFVRDSKKWDLSLLISETMMIHDANYNSLAIRCNAMQGDYIWATIRTPTTGYCTCAKSNRMMVSLPCNICQLASANIDKSIFRMKVHVHTGI